MTGNGVVPCPWQNCPQGGPMRVANDIAATVSSVKGQ